MDARQYDKAYMLFGSSCRLLAGKISAKDYLGTLESLWRWSKQKVEDLHHDTLDVPMYEPSATNGTPAIPVEAPTLPPLHTNGSPDPDLPPPAEKLLKAPDPNPIPTEEAVFISDEQVVRLAAHAYKQGFSEMGLLRYLQTQGIKSPSQTPLSKARELWNALREPTLVQQYQ